MIKKILQVLVFFLIYNYASANQNDKLYEKIDLFGEVLERIQNEYVDEINQSDVMDSAINGVLQSHLTLILHICPLIYLKICKLIPEENLVVLV